MNQLRENIKPYSKAIVKLLKGTVDKKEAIWNDVLNYQAEIQGYISKIGLELIVKEEDGFAFVKQFENNSFLKYFFLPIRNPLVMSLISPKCKKFNK